MTMLQSSIFWLKIQPYAHIKHLYTNRRLQYCRVSIKGPYFENPIIYTYTYNTYNLLHMHNLSRLCL